MSMAKLFSISIIFSLLVLSGVPSRVGGTPAPISGGNGLTLAAVGIVEAPGRGDIVVNTSVDGNGYVYLYRFGGKYYALVFDEEASKEYVFSIDGAAGPVDSVTLWMNSIDDAALGIRSGSDAYVVVLRDGKAVVHHIRAIYYYGGIYIRGISVESGRRTVNVTIEYSSGAPDSNIQHYRFSSRRITLGTRPRIAFTTGYLFIVGMYETNIIYLPGMKHWKYTYLEPAPVEAGAPSAVAILSREGDRPLRVAYLSGSTIRILDFGEDNVSLVKKFRTDTICYPEYIHVAGENTLYIVCREGLHIIRDFMDNPVNYILKNSGFYTAGSVNDHPVIIYGDTLLVRPPGNSSLHMVFSPRVAVIYEIQSGVSGNRVEPLRTRPLEPVIWYYSKLALTPGVYRLRVEDYGYPYVPLKGTGLTVEPDLAMGSGAFTVFLRGGISYYTPLLAAGSRVVIRAYSMRETGLGVKAYYVSADMTTNKSVYDLFVGYMAGVPSRYSVYENAWFFDPDTKRLAQVLYVNDPDTGSWRAVVAVSRVTASNVTVEKRIDIGDPGDNDPYHIALTRDGYIILVYGGYDHIHIDVYSPSGERISHITDPPQPSPSIRGSVSVAGIIPCRDGWLVLFRFDGAAMLYPAYHVSRTGVLRKVHASTRLLDETGVYGGVAVIVDGNDSTTIVAPENGMHAMYGGNLYTVYPYSGRIYIVRRPATVGGDTEVYYLRAPQGTLYTMINNTHLYVFTRIGNDVAAYRYTLPLETTNTTHQTGKSTGETHGAQETQENTQGGAGTANTGDYTIYILGASLAMAIVIALVIVIKKMCI